MQCQVLLFWYHDTSTILAGSSDSLICESIQANYTVIPFFYRCKKSKMINPQMNLFIKSIYIQCIDRIAAKCYIYKTQVVGDFEWSSAHSLCMGNFSIKNTQIGIGTWSLKEADQLGTVFTASLTTVLHYVDKFLPTMFSTILLLFCWIYYIVVGVCYCSLWKNYMGWVAYILILLYR